MIHNICLFIFFYLRKILLISSICLIYKLFFYNKKKKVTINDDNIQDPNGNQYIVESKIGKGTFGKVVQCRVKDATYALKVQTNYFNGEVHLLQAVKGSKYCVQMFSSFVNGPLLYIVFEKLHKSVYDVLCLKAMSNTDVVSISRQMLEALRFLKSKHIIHCDIKPENIMFVSDNDNTVKLIDFGLAMYDYQSDRQYTISSPPYRCPENILSIDWSFEADIWSLGCVICEMKSGNRFFDSGEYFQDSPNDDAQCRHLCEIETVCGVFPKQMVQKSKVAKKFFCSNGASNRLLSKQLSKESREILKKQKLITQLFHSLAGDLVKRMLAIDPVDRITPENALNHNFFFN